MKLFKATEQRKAPMKNAIEDVSGENLNSHPNAVPEPFGPPGATNLDPSSKWDMDALIDDAGHDQALRDNPEVKDFLDIGYDPKTDSVQMDQQTFYTKVHYMLSDETRNQDLRKDIEKYQINNDEDYAKLQQAKEMIYRANYSVHSIWGNRIQYLIMQHEYALVCQSSRYAALFAEIGHLAKFVNLNNLGLDYIGAGSNEEDITMAPPYEIQFMQASAVATAVYNAALLKRLEPSDNPDFIALTDLDIYHLANYLVPPLLNLFSILRYEAKFYRDKMFIDYSNELRSLMWDKQRAYRKEHEDPKMLKRDPDDFEF